MVGVRGVRGGGVKGAAEARLLERLRRCGGGSLLPKATKAVGWIGLCGSSPGLAEAVRLSPQGARSHPESIGRQQCVGCRQRARKVSYFTAASAPEPSYLRHITEHQRQTLRSLHETFRLETGPCIAAQLDVVYAQTVRNSPHGETGAGEGESPYPPSDVQGCTGLVRPTLLCCR